MSSRSKASDDAPPSNREPLPLVCFDPHVGRDAEAQRGFRLMEAISQERQVVCLCPSPGGAARHNRIPHTRKISDRLTFVYNAFPIHTSALRSGVASDTAHGDTRAMRRILRSCGIDRYIYWLANPHIDALTGLDRSRLILDCSDPTLFASEATGLMPGTETILREARLVFSASETLCQHLQSHHSSVFHLPDV